MGCPQVPEKWFRDEKLIFAFSVIIGLSVSLFSLIFIHDIYRDSANVYAYAAREIANGNFAEGWQGRVPMLNILLSAALSFCGVEAFRATVSRASFICSPFFPCGVFWNSF